MYLKWIVGTHSRRASRSFELWTKQFSQMSVGVEIDIFLVCLKGVTRCPIGATGQYYILYIYPELNKINLKMKPLVILGIVSLILSSTGYAQPSRRTHTEAAPTTEEEYNYLTRGYATQVADGLDMKKGYHFTGRMENRQVGNYTFTMKVLMRDATDEVAGILVIVHSNAWNKTYYLCIPHGNDALENRCLADLNAWDKPITQAYCALISAGFGELMSEAYEMKKQIKN